MSSISVGYATLYGSTQEVAEMVAATLRNCQLAVDVQLVREVRTLVGYDAIVLGAPLFMFHWHPDALHFLLQFRDTLRKRPFGIFALGPTHVPHDEKEWQDSRAQLDKELAKFSWLAPASFKMFGGKYDPSKLCFRSSNWRERLQPTISAIGPRSVPGQPAWHPLVGTVVSQSSE